MEVCVYGSVCIWKCVYGSECIWKCAYDRIVYIVKKGINIFFKKGFLGGAQCCLVGEKVPPLHKMLYYAPEYILLIYHHAKSEAWQLMTASCHVFWFYI